MEQNTVIQYHLLKKMNVLLFYVSHQVFSLRSKRFRGVGEQRKSEKQDFRRFVRAKNGVRAKKRKEGGG